MELSGHIGEVFAARFDPAGHFIASGSMDRTISKPNLSGGTKDETLIVGQICGEHTATARTMASSRDIRMRYLICSGRETLK